MNTAYDAARKGIESFLTSPTSDVLLITGAWGVGKTHVWDECLRKASKNSSLTRPKYAYVSLFSVGTFDELRNLVFVNTTASAAIGERLSLTSTVRQTIGFAQGATRAATNKVTGLTPRAKAVATKMLERVDQSSGVYSALAATVLDIAIPHSVSDTLVCIDDLDRRPEQLDVARVLGYADELRTVHRCKVVLIANEAQLDDSDMKLSRYLEKVIDRKLTLEPNPGEAYVASVTNGYSDPVELKEIVLELGIKNIRIIRRIRSLLDDLEPLLKGRRPDVRRRAIRALAILAWRYLDRTIGDEVPNLTVLLDVGFIAKMDRREIEQALKAFESHKSSSADQIEDGKHVGDRALMLWMLKREYRPRDLERSLFNYIESGSVGATDLPTRLQDEEAALERENKYLEYRKVWDSFHRALDQLDASVFAQKLHSVFLESLSHHNIPQLLSVTQVLTKLGHAELADDALKGYVAHAVAHNIDKLRTSNMDDPLPVHIKVTLDSAYEASLAKQLTSLDALTAWLKGEDISTHVHTQLNRVTADDVFHVLSAGVESLAYNDIVSKIVDRDHLHEALRKALLQVPLTRLNRQRLPRVVKRLKRIAELQSAAEQLQKRLDAEFGEGDRNTFEAGNDGMS